VPPNPFSPGVFHSDQALFGREDQFRIVEQVVDQIDGGYPHSPVGFLGPPGLGKTATLKYFGNDLKRRNWLCGYSEAGSDIGSAIYDILADAQQFAPAQGPVRRLLSRVQGFSAAAGPISIGLDLQSIEDGSAYVRLVELFQTLSNAARFDFVGAALFLDEAQVLPGSHLEVLFRALNAVADSPIVLFVGALPNLPDRVAVGSRSTPHVLLSNLKPLDDVSAQRALIDPAQQAGGEFDADALTVLLEFASGHPLVLQMLGHSTWNLGVADAPDNQIVTIRAIHALQAVEEVRGQLKLGYYRPTWRSCAISERRLLKALAQMHDVTDGLLREAIQSDIEDADNILYDLVGRGIVSVDARRVTFVLPGFGDFVKIC
jgi:AAA ATPase domain